MLCVVFFVPSLIVFIGFANLFFYPLSSGPVKGSSDQLALVFTDCNHSFLVRFILVFVVGVGVGCLVLFIVSFVVGGGGDRLFVCVVAISVSCLPMLICCCSCPWKPWLAREDYSSCSLCTVCRCLLFVCCFLLLIHHFLLIVSCCC